MITTLQPEMSKKHTLDKEYDEIDGFLIQANMDIFQAEEEEDYSQAAFIQMAVHLYLENKAVLFGELLGKPASIIFDKLAESSTQILEKIRAAHN